MSSALSNLLECLKIPVPDSTHIFVTGDLYHLEHVLRHLAKLIVAREDTSKCLAYLDAKYTVSDVENTLSG